MAQALSYVKFLFSSLHSPQNFKIQSPLTWCESLLASTKHMRLHISNHLSRQPYQTVQCWLVRSKVCEEDVCTTVCPQGSFLPIITKKDSQLLCSSIKSSYNIIV